MSTTTLLQTTSSSPETATIMLSPTSELDGGRVVRFDSECVLIPDHSRSKRPRVLTKSYSLPLWKRKAQQTSDSEGGEDVLASPVAEETHVVLKVYQEGVEVTEQGTLNVNVATDSQASVTMSCPPIAVCIRRFTPPSLPSAHTTTFAAHLPSSSR
ncbi:hypothetical protein BDQ12DRAFT_665976 [Crucibulum laeve]|uniref:Uncharacterized protein n=1 Tax=Crucibulum laeve TaxID=68775 RepID=A0A5C3M155_9AGAR|nr:hypothetical protein BDQ12DRAFT_665976 [Crucibulum laeve]